MELTDEQGDFEMTRQALYGWRFYVPVLGLILALVGLVYVSITSSGDTAGHASGAIGVCAVGMFLILFGIARGRKPRADDADRTKDLIR